MSNKGLCIAVIGKNVMDSRVARMLEDIKDVDKGSVLILDSMSAIPPYPASLRELRIERLGADLDSYSIPIRFPEEVVLKRGKSYHEFVSPRINKRKGGKH